MEHPLYMEPLKNKGSNIATVSSWVGLHIGGDCQGFPPENLVIMAIVVSESPLKSKGNPTGPQELPVNLPRSV